MFHTIWLRIIEFMYLLKDVLDLTSPWRVFVLVMDLAIVLFISYYIIRILRQTRAKQIVKGILMLVFLVIIAKVFNMVILNFILTNFVTYGVILLIVVFQPEIRNVFEKLGRSKLVGVFDMDDNIMVKHSISEIVKAVEIMSLKKIGALIVIERNTKVSEVLKENKKLQNQVDDLTNQLNVTKLEQYELDNYRELLDLDDKYSGYQKVAANVIAMDGTNWFSSFTIDKGSKEGIKKGMNVIAGSGLVGIVTDVGPNFAKVRSIIDDSSNVSSMVLTTKDNFNVGGSLKSMNQDKVLPFTELRDEDDKVKVGDPVVTSYVSDQYQEGILIGYIASIEKNANNLTKSGTITPVVDFQHLREVLVITTLKDTGEKELSSQKASDTQTETQDNTETQKSQE